MEVRHQSKIITNIIPFSSRTVFITEVIIFLKAEYELLYTENSVVKALSEETFIS